MPSKEELYSSLTRETVFNDTIYKKIYGYSVTDKSFLDRVCNRLLELGRIDAMKGYNEWFARWKAEDDATGKEVGEWYVKWSKEEEVEKKWRQEPDELKQRKGQLLQQKKQLLLRKRQILTHN
jgi:hypothetical protein